MLKFGIIGAGAIPQTGFDGITASGKAEVLAVADINDKRLKAFASRNRISRTYTDAAKLIADKDLDAVYIAVPNTLHVPFAVAALEAGKHVICEKPFAPSLNEATKAAEAAKKSGKLFMVGMNQRFAEDSQKIKALSEKGYFGEIYNASATWRRRCGAPRLGTWFGNTALAGGGCLYDIGVHMLDLSMFLMDNFEAESVSGATYSKFGSRGLGEGSWGKSDPEGLLFDVDDFATALIKLKGGATINLNISWACNQKAREIVNVDLHGTEAGATCYPAEVYRFEKGVGTYSDVGGITVDVRYPHHDRFVNFVKSILGEEKPCVTIAQSLKVQGVLDAIYASSREGHEIRIKAGA
jgi:predicted dehydrogenase